MAVEPVVHAAGISGRFAPLTEVDAAEFAEVVAAKVTGAIHLDTLLEGQPLDAFVLISSIAGVWGSGGQVAYAAGNAFLDALAHQRRVRGLVATSVACGPWAEEGMAAHPTIRTHLLQRGLPAMAPQVATTALWQAVATGEAASIVADVDWQRFLPTFTAARASYLFEDMSGTGGPTDVDPTRTGGSGASPVPQARTRPDPVGDGSRGSGRDPRTRRTHGHRCRAPVPRPGV